MAEKEKKWKKNKLFILSIFTLIISHFFPLSNRLIAKEQDIGISIIDKETWKNSIMREKGDYVHYIAFDKAIIKTYFKEQIMFNNGQIPLKKQPKPIKQEINFFIDKKKFLSKNYEYETWSDGAVTLSFKYDIVFEKEGNKFDAITTAISQEVIKDEAPYRYVLWRELK